MSWKDHANNSWRAEEAAFAIVVAIASNEDSEEYDRFLNKYSTSVTKSNEIVEYPLLSYFLTRSHCFGKCNISCIFTLRKSRTETLLRRTNQNHP